MAIETAVMLRLAFGRPWRQTEGLLRSVAGLLDVAVGVPDHTTLSRRSALPCPWRPPWSRLKGRCTC